MGRGLVRICWIILMASFWPGPGCPGTPWRIPGCGIPGMPPGIPGAAG